MKIEKLIWVFEQLIPIYKQAIDGKWGYGKLQEENLCCGICWASKEVLGIDIYKTINNYYTHYLNCRLNLFEQPNKVYIKIPLQKRLDFMKSEIPQLKKLIKLGYTHI